MSGRRDILKKGKMLYLEPEFIEILERARNSGRYELKNDTETIKHSLKILSRELEQGVHA